MEQQALISTQNFADRVDVKLQTIHKGYCHNGHYLGIKPVKLPNRRLLWPVAAIETVLNGGAQ